MEIKKNKISLKTINKLAIPAILGGISEPLISLADNAIVGKLGTIELGSVGIANSFFTLFLWGLSSLKSAISSIIAVDFGAKKLEESKTLIPQALIISFIVGVFCYLFTAPYSSIIFKYYNADGEILKNAVNYYNIRALGYPLSLTTFSLFGVFRGYQNTSWAMMISLFGTLVNIVFDYAFVFGICMDANGVEGAAWASVIAQAIILLLAIVYLFRKLPDSFKFSLEPNSKLKNLLAMGGNLFLRTLSLNIAFYLASRYATSYGEHEIAAHTVAVNIWLFSSFFIDGYANAGNALAGKILGENNNDKLYHTGIKLVKISILVGALLSLVYALTYFKIINFFSNDIEVKNQFYSIYWIVILSQPINAIAFSLDGIFKGLGNAQLLRNVLFIGTFLIFIPVLLLLDYLNLFLIAIWIAFLCWMIFRGGSLLLIFRRNFHTK